VPGACPLASSAQPASASEFKRSLIVFVSPFGDLQESWLAWPISLAVLPISFTAEGILCCVEAIVRDYTPGVRYEGIHLQFASIILLDSRWSVMFAPFAIMLVEHLVKLRLPVLGEAEGSESCLTAVFIIFEQELGSLSTMLLEED